MATEAVIGRLHEIAADLVSASGASVEGSTDGDNLLQIYGFSSIDALEFLLVVEEEFGVTFEDEDLSEETVSSARRLASYVSERLDAAPGAS